MQVVREVGYAQTTTRAVSAAAGVAEGTLYRHFPTKASLLLAAVLEQSAPILARVAELPARAGQATVAANLTECLTELTRMREVMLPLELALLTDPELGRPLRQPPPAELDPAVQLAAYLEAEQKLGRVRGDVPARSAAVVLLATLFGLQAAPPEAREHMGTVSVADAVDIVLTGLSGSPDAQPDR
jgi:AcrR family transcriptional regulator